MVGLQVGDRGLAMAQAILHQITQLLAPGCIPLFLSDGNPNYLTAIVGHFGHWVQRPRHHDRGRLAQTALDAAAGAALRASSQAHETAAQSWR